MEEVVEIKVLAWIKISGEIFFEFGVIEFLINWGESHDYIIFSLSLCFFPP